MTSKQYVHLYRHDLSKHDLDDDVYRHDPLLTTSGIQSAKKALEGPNHCFNKPTLVLTSPLGRCIQTALYAFHPKWNDRAAEFFNDGPPRFVVMPQLQEISEKPCDTSRPLEFLKEECGTEVEFPSEWFTNNDWLIKRGTQYSNDDELLAQRAEFVRQYIKGLPDREVVVVTHRDFIQHLGNQWVNGRAGSCSYFGHVRTGEVVTTVIDDLRDSKTELIRETPPWASRDADDLGDLDDLDY